MNSKNNIPKQEPKRSAKPSEARENVTLPRSEDDRFVQKAFTPPQPTDASKKAAPPAKKAASSGEKTSSAKKEDAPVKNVPPSKWPRVSAPKKRAVEQEIDPAEEIRRQFGLSEDDTDIIFELGYDSELRQTVGQENLQKLKLSYERKLRAADRRQYRTAFGYRGEEYDGKNHREGILSAFFHDRGILILRLVLTALATLILLLLDSAIASERAIADMTSIQPRNLWLTPLISLLLLLGTAALSHRQIIAGARSLIRFSPTPYSASAVLLAITLIYDVCMLFSRAPMFQANFLVALCLLVTAVSDLLRVSGEIRVFRLLSTEKEKQVLVPAEPRRRKLRRGDRIVKVVHEDSGKNLYRVQTAEQVSGFFRRFNTMESAGAPFMTFTVIMLAFSVLCAFAATVYQPGLSGVLSAFMTVLLLCAPVPSIFGYFYSLFLANRLLARYDCALVGNETVEEYDVEKTVIFPDSDLLSARKQTEVATGEGTDLKRDLVLSGLLFAKLGGPLADILKITKRTRGDATVSILRLAENGVEARIDNQYALLAGSADFLRKSGVEIPEESADKAMRRTPNVSPLYVAVNGELRLRFEIEYECKQEFECLISDLAYSGSAVAIYTYDPSLNEEFLPLCRPRRPDPVSVYKPTRVSEDIPLESVDAGAVALGSHLDLVYPLHAAAGVASARRFAARMQVISAILGTAAAVLLTVFGRYELLSILSIAGYQLFWTLLTALASHAELNPETLRFRK